jgi:4-hydroxyproline epimerase
MGTVGENKSPLPEEKRRLLSLVLGGAPHLEGTSTSAMRQDFLNRSDWIRTALCLEPRSHDMMSGGFLYPPTLAGADCCILFIETSGCLPMCGHGTMGIITLTLQNGLIAPHTPGRLVVEAPRLCPMNVDVAYGGNFYAIVEPQGEYRGLDDVSASDLVAISWELRAAIQAKYEPVHQDDPTIRGVSHILWADNPKNGGAHGRKAVFYGD